MSKIDSGKINDFERINPIRQSDVKQAGRAGAQRSEGKPPVGEDKLQLSSQASDVGKYVEQLKELPDAGREERINALREQISAGEYKPSSADIAAAILKEEGNG